MSQQQTTASGGQTRWDPILARAASDTAVRNGLLSDPRGTIRAEFGIELPRDFQVRFVEKGAALDVVLAAAPDPDGGLSEDELDSVAGGVDGAWEDPNNPPPPPPPPPGG
ncbi:MAG TPA: hypothetical protein VFE05_21685 [Longimicrobiaceae bacterium]|nr:hypothetical protein [Longimicrobiaceae bacterium]